MRVFRLVLLAAAAAIAGGPAAGQTVRTVVAADSVSVGERIQVTVSVRHDGSRVAIFPDAGLTGEGTPPGALAAAGDLELLTRLNSGSRMLPDGSRLDSVLYEATTFALDTARVAAEVGLATEMDTTLFASVTGTLPVRSVVPEDAEDIQDLAPLVEFPRTIWPWLLLLIAVAAALWYFLRRRPAVEVAPQAPPEPAEPPFDEAMRRIHDLAGREPEEGMKPYFVELSDIVRTYLARRTAVPARELTTSELIQALRERPVLPTERIGEVREVLSQSDLVKFADQRPAPDRARHTLETARASIERAEHDLRPAASSGSDASASPEIE